jgi:predicted nucleic acid-binding protein
LRAADALQLAAALEWSQDVPQGRVFLTADQKLREAALMAGFEGERI